MKILIACEKSGIVRDAFSALGHDAWSADVLPTERPGNHLQCDVREVLHQGWDMMIAHPPCQYLSRAGARWKSPERDQAAINAFNFVMELWNAPIPAIAIENPIGRLNTLFRYPDQVIHPYFFGDPYTKATCLWLKGLPVLLYTLICTDPFVNWTEYARHGPNKASSRSKTFPGIARAMAAQWGQL